jgi:hypothetical protein
MSHDQYNKIVKCTIYGIIETDRCDSCDPFFKEGCTAKEVTLSESPCDFSNDPAILIEEIDNPNTKSIEESAKRYSKHLSRSLTIDYAFIAGAKSEAAKQYWKNYFKHN